MLRRLKHSPVFALVTVFTLAVSIGAAATMFTVVNAFLLSALPYEDAERLVMVWNTQQPLGDEAADAEIPLSPGAFNDLRERRQSLERIAAFVPESVTLTSGDEATRVHALFVTGDFFPVLGQQALKGRVLRPQDVQQDAPPVVIISYGLWQRKFGGDPDILGRTIEFGGQVRNVVGVLPAAFRFSESLVSADPGLTKAVDLWIPFSAAANAHERGYHYLTTIAKLAPGVTLQVARADVEAYAARVAEQFPDTDRTYGIDLVRVHDQIFGHLRPALLSLLAATIVLLLIACVNLATLLMARVEQRQGDLAVRLILGASRSRILSESLAETIALSVAGGALAFGVAFFATKLLTALSPVHVLQSYPPELDMRVALFTLGVSVAAGLLFGAAPAVRASRIDSGTGLAYGSTRLTNRSRLAFSVLAATQIALATTLLIGAGLTFRSFNRLLQADLGIRLENVATFDLFLTRSHYREAPNKVAFLHELLDRIEALPGVESVGMNYALPLSGVNPSNGFEIEGGQRSPGEDPSANLGLVNPGYFETLAIPVLHGRPFLEIDTADAPRVAIIDEQMMKQYFDGRNPLGRQISVASDELLTIVGVVGAVKQQAIDDVARPYVYVPYQQRSYMFTSFAVKTSLEDPLSLAQPVREIVRDLDSAIAISNPSTLEDSYWKAISPQRFTLVLMSVFAGISLFLTLVGIYGLMSFLVRQREREAGIRLALGAHPRRVFRLIIGQGFAVSLTGTLVGLGIAAAARRAMAHLTYGVEPLDAMVFAIVPVVTLIAAFLAYFPPARALSRIDPNRSLRAV